MRAFIFLFLLSLFSAEVYAFNKENHRLITERAIELLLEKYGRDYLSEKEINSIVKGNLSEESLNFKSLIRPYNQHYFNPEKDSSLWQRKNSIDVRFDRLVAEFYAKHNTSGYDRSIGEIIHFIQDAASPSHVVPIEHEEEEDIFDSMKLGTLLPTEMMEEKFLSCTMEYPQFLLRKLSSKTLQNIDKKFPVRTTEGSITYEDSLAWDVFWEKDTGSWFGSYGKLGNENFLKEKISVEGKTYKVDPSVYQKFIEKQLDLAVLYTARFIYFAKSLINEEGEIVAGAEG